MNDALAIVVGCGSIGLPLAVALSSAGCDVLGVDTDPSRVEALNRGTTELLDEGLPPALHDAVRSGRLRFAASIPSATTTRSYLVCVPTPSRPEGGCDSGALDAAMAMVDAVAVDNDLVCLRSTVPIGTARALSGRAGAAGLRYAACPDRTVSGRSFREQFEIPQLVGGLDEESGRRAATLLGRLAPVVSVRDPETAEAIKLFSNIARDAQFALANQFARLCEAAGIDYSEVRRAGHHGYPRLQLARPGPVGGPCLSKDLHLLGASPSLRGQDMGLLYQARAVNEAIWERVHDAILKVLLDGAVPVAILGMAFKGSPPTTDRRGAIGVALQGALLQARPGLDLRCWDPLDRFAQTTRQTALDGAGIVVLANDHPEVALTAVDFERLAAAAIVHDLAGVLPRELNPPGVRVIRLGEGRLP